MRHKELRLARSAQKFGGPWSLIKIETVAAYFAAFNRTLKHQGFNKVYIDAFAGSGDFQFKARDASPLFDEAEVIEVHAGSARRALETKPPFDRLVFVESGARNANALSKVLLQFPDANAEILRGDANVEVKRMCQSINWDGASGTRGVIFLDPFGNSVDWSTIKELGKTKLDVWYLFPLAGVYRNAPNDWGQLNSEKRQAITRVLGAPEWESRFYEPPSNKQGDIFSLLDAPEQSNPGALPHKRTLNVDGIEAFVMERLKTVFPFVLPPRRLLGPTNAPLFSLFFAMANKSHAAWGVARPIAKHLLEST
jgi:three-Cys-motif partner protein